VVPLGSPVRVLRGRARLGIGDLSGAREDLKEALQEDPKRADAMVGRRDLLWEEKETSSPNSRDWLCSRSGRGITILSRRIISTRAKETWSRGTLVLRRRCSWTASDERRSDSWSGLAPWRSFGPFPARP